MQAPASFSYAATPRNTRATARALGQAVADMRARPWIEHCAWSRFFAEHGRSPSDAEWVAMRPALYEHYGPPCPIEVRLAQRVAA